MRVVVRRGPLGRILKWTQRAFLACGVLLLGYCGYALADAWYFQRRESSELDQELRDQRVASEGAAQPQTSISPRRAPATTVEGLIGRIDIPRLLLSAVVIEGIGKTVLRRAVGHVPGSALPGNTGNIIVAGHRDTFFRGLKDLKTRDEIQFSTSHGNFKYVVESLTVVEPGNVGSLAQSEDNVLTMVTCYPFFYLGAAPKRFVVRARQVSPQAVALSTVE